MEGSLVAYKVFTNGSTLQASELNENLMQQATAVFSNAAARTAAITSPVEGQLTYLEDTNLYQHWNGSSWVSPFGSTLINSTTFTSTSSLAIDNVFSADYDVYQIIISYTSASSAAEVEFNLRAGGVTDTSNNYFNVFVQGQSSSATAASQIGTSSCRIGRLDQSGAIVNFTISNPFLSQRSYGVGQSIDSAVIVRNYGIMMAATTPYDGFRVNTTSSAGIIRVYGMRKN
jgi:hypothetical protein